MLQFSSVYLAFGNTKKASETKIRFSRWLKKGHQQPSRKKNERKIQSFLNKLEKKVSLI